MNKKIYKLETNISAVLCTIVHDGQKILKTHLKERLDLPSMQIDLKAFELTGSEFQLSVWKQIQSIPAGQTRTYKQIAQQIGRPQAFRAVGSAVGKNPFPGLIPCHRVIAVNGPGGFSAHGGLDTKLIMLRNEGVL